MGNAVMAVTGALGVLFMSTGALLVGLRFQSQGLKNFSSWRMLCFIASVMTGRQFAEFFGWAAVTGLLVALGVGAPAVTRTRAVAVFAAGALVPVGLALAAHALDQVWPGTTGPTDAPGMAVSLALYSLAVPWILGRLIARGLPIRRDLPT